MVNISYCRNIYWVWCEQEAYHFFYLSKRQLFQMRGECLIAPGLKASRGVCNVFAVYAASCPSSSTKQAAPGVPTAWFGCTGDLFCGRSLPPRDGVGFASAARPDIVRAIHLRWRSTSSSTSPSQCRFLPVCGIFPKLVRQWRDEPKPSWCTPI